MPSMEEHVRLRKAHIQEHGLPVADVPVAPVETLPRPAGELPPDLGEVADRAAAHPAALPAHPDLDAFMVLRLDAGPATFDGQIRSEYAGLPERFAVSLQGLIDAFDAARCWKCGQQVGYYLDGDADEITGWYPCALVDGSAHQDGHGGLVVDPVSWQCEACAPDTAAQPWPDHLAPSWWPADLGECATEPGGARRMHVMPVGATACRCGELAPRERPQVAGR